jgi:hypothetical protein
MAFQRTYAGKQEDNGRNGCLLYQYKRCCYTEVSNSKQNGDINMTNTIVIEADDTETSRNGDDHLIYTKDGYPTVNVTVNPNRSKGRTFIHIRPRTDRAIMAQRIPYHQFIHDMVTDNQEVFYFDIDPAGLPITLSALRYSACDVYLPAGCIICRDLCPCCCKGKIDDHDDRGYGCWACPVCGEDSDTDLHLPCTGCEAQ